MQATFQPSWKGDVKIKQKNSNTPDKEMWGSGLKDQAIDQSIVYTRTRQRPLQRKDTKGHIAVLQDIMGVQEKEELKQDTLGNMRQPLKGDSELIDNMHTAQVLSKHMRRSSFKQEKQKRHNEKHNKSNRQTTHQLYKSIIGSAKGNMSATGESMALAVVKQTAALAKIAGENAMQVKRRPTYDDLLAKVQDAETSVDDASGPPDLPIGLPRGRLVTTHVFLLGRKMKLEILRIGRIGVHYEAQDDDMRTYILESTEREIFDSLSKPHQEEISNARSVDVQIPFLVARLGFRVSTKDKRKKELCIVKSKSLHDGVPGTVQGKTRWGKMRKLTSDIGEDMFQRRIHADSEDVASIVGLGMLKVRQGLQYDACILFVRAVRTANIVCSHPETGHHNLVPGANMQLSEKNSVFGANFWNTMARTAFETYLDDLRLQVLNVALDASEIAARFLENIANQQLWILRGRIHESLGHLQAASDLYEHCISKFAQGQALNEVMLRAAAVAKRLGRFTRCVAYLEYTLINPPSGFSQSDILFQVARAHEQEGKVDVASDGFRQAFKFRRRMEAAQVAKDSEKESAIKKTSRFPNRRKEPRSWRDWINRQETWEMEADRSFQAGYFSISIDMTHRSLMLGERRMQAEMEKPFGGESEKMKVESSKNWWRAAVSARHLGELHTSLKACEEAVNRDPDNKIAVDALEKWNSFFLDGAQADAADPEMMMDSNVWGNHMFTGEFNSEELKHAMEKQTRAALKMESMQSHGVEGNIAKKVRGDRRISRRLSVISGKSLGTAAAATAAAASAAANMKTKQRVTRMKSSRFLTEGLQINKDTKNTKDVDTDILDDEEDRRRLENKCKGFTGSQRRRRMRPMSAAAAQTVETDTATASKNKRPASASLKREKLSSKARRMEKLVGFALRHLAIIGSYDLERLKLRAMKVGVKFGFAGTIHAYLATILIEEKAILHSDIKSSNFMIATDKLCRDVNVVALMSTSSESRPNLRDLRRSARSPSAVSMSLSMLSPNGKQLLSSESAPSTEQVERLYRGRGGTSHFDPFLNNNNRKSGGKRLNSVVEKAIHTHSVTKASRTSRTSRNSRNSQKSRTKTTGSRTGGNSQRTNMLMRVTRVPSGRGELVSMAKTGPQRSWPGERPRRNHSTKQRRNWAKETMEYEKTKPRILIMQEGKLEHVRDPILMSRVLGKNI